MFALRGGIMNEAIWLIIAVVLGVIEASTSTLVTIWFALAALIVAGIAIFVENIWVLFAIFIIISAVLVVITRPLTKRFLNKRTVATNADRIILAKGIVTEQIDPIQNTGQVRVLGQIWSAKAVDGEPIEVDAIVMIKALEGVKVVVERAE